MNFKSYFNTAVLLISQYDGSIPLAYYLKQYFAQHKKHGSKDRKWISHLCYAYYRIGHVLKEYTVEERLLVALFLCNEEAGEWSILFDQQWLNNWNNNIQARIDFIQSIYTAFAVADIFPWTDHLSEGIEAKDFIISHLIQPDLFLRIRPGNEMTVLKKLTAEKIPFKQLPENCLALPNASKIDTVLEIDKEVVIQDYSSQRIADFLKLIPYPLPLNTSVWDCCSASGGKSILAKDVLNNIYLTVSDIRPSILKNLNQRFKNAGIKSYHSFVCNLANSKPQTPNFKLIICDAPCSGSGTWGRTPEQLYFFSQEKIHEYAVLQAKIISNIVSRLSDDGYLLYITCSVFKEENEMMTAMIVKECSLQLVRSKVIKGYGNKADSMYAVLFKK
jgi:16S rRNA (cytosine967-C5)-methyltransferase